MANNAETSTVTDDKKNEKIKKVLEKLLEPNCKLKNDVYLNLFLTHLFENPDNNKNGISPHQKVQLCQWLIDALNLWLKNQTDPSSVILLFSLNLAKNLSTEEEIFLKLNEKDVYNNLVGFAETNIENDTNVTFELVSLLCSLMEHKSGTQWILASRYWSDIVILGRDAPTIYIRKNAYEFVAKLLTNSINLNRNFCCNLIRVLNKPLYDALIQISDNEQTDLFKSAQPVLKLISETLELLLKNLQNDVLQLFISLRTVDLVRKLQDLSKIEDLSFELVKIRVICLFANLSLQKSTSKSLVLRQVAHDSTVLAELKTLFYIIEAEMYKDHIRCVIQISYYAHKLYGNLFGKMPLCIRKGEPIEFHNQMIMFQILPLMIYMTEKQGIKTEVLMKDAFKREFLTKLVKMCAIKTLQMCFRWKERLAIKTDIVDELTFSLQYLLKAKSSLTLEQAGFFFQPLVYTLNDLVSMLDTNTFQFDSSFINFTHTLLETMIDLIETFNLTWKDSVETACVMESTYNFLKHKQLDNFLQIVVPALKLLNLTMTKYMSFEMALLMESPENSVMAYTANLLNAKCQDRNWEIRDSALKCVQSLASNAKSKFPSYTILLNADLPELVIQLALYDFNGYVRTTAFKCLNEMIEIEQIWEIFIQMYAIFDKILNAIENDNQGIVRKEAVLLVYNIYKHQSFPVEILPRLYDTMTHAAISDLHWEVKCNALRFWFKVFEKHLNEQGMVDKTFPPYIFSKEQKKIIEMTETEIRKRVIKALNQLSHVGCLYVIKFACLEDCDVEVSRKAVSRVNKIAKAFQVYKIPCDNIDTDPPPRSTDLPNPTCSTCNFASPDSIQFNIPFLRPLFDSALSTLSFPDNQEPDLTLEDLFNSTSMLFLSASKHQATKNTRKNTYLAPSEFLKFMYNEAKLCNDQNQWLNSHDEFNSLLDDILKEFDVLHDDNVYSCVNE